MRLGVEDITIATNGDPADPTDDNPGTLVPNSETTITANGNAVQLDGDLVPGTYTVCETVMPGWSTSLNGGTGQYTLVISLSNERICTDVEVTVANQDITLTVDNTPPPGGEQRTICFWKNWSSCDGKGNQDPVLDETLQLAGGSILVGNLNVDTCLEAIRILDKSTVNNGTKKASDPGFNLAAQYLAARLNQAAGAEDSCITQTLADAQTALASYGFDGTKVMTKAQIKSLGPTFNALATTLDQYNNGLLC
jgi:hypothetical protein